MSPRSIDRRLLSGVWDRLYPGVYRPAGAPATWRQSLLAACLSWGDGATVSHRAAAALWELAGFRPGSIELTVPRGRQRARGHVLHRPVALAAVDVTKIEAIPVTTVARTLIDIAGFVRAEVVEEALDDAFRRGLMTPSRVRGRLRETGGRGRQGTLLIGKLIDARAHSSAVPQSVFETRLLRILCGARLPMPAIQHKVRTHRGLAILDLAYVEQRVAIEADGFRWHSSRQQWDRDRARNNALAMLGWTVIHVTWLQLRDRPEEVLEAIRATLSQGR
jgi:very-short-patch-repair endonuclease